MLKNSSTLAVPVPVNFSIKLGFVSVNSPNETYLMDVLRINFGKHTGAHSGLKAIMCFHETYIMGVSL